MSLRELAKNKIGGNVGRVLSVIYNRLPLNNRFSIRGKDNQMQLAGNYLKHSRIVIRGNGNQIIFKGGGNNFLNHCTLKIYGNNNRIVLSGERNSLLGVEIWIEDDGNRFEAGSRNVILHGTHLALTEGCEIRFGDDNLFSSYCVFRTGDSHSILSAITGERINPARSIRVADRVWGGARTTLLKGASVAADSIIATGSVVTKTFEESNVLIGGTPARVLKQQVKWLKERI